MSTSGREAQCSPRPLTFTAQPEVWQLVANQWYGERAVRFDRDVHRAAEKLMADVDDALREVKDA